MEEAVSPHPLPRVDVGAGWRCQLVLVVRLTAILKDPNLVSSDEARAPGEI